MRPLRVVLDTNVLISALLFRTGRMRWIEPLWTGNRIVPLVSKATVEEMIRVLQYPKFRLTPLDRQTVLEAFLPYVGTVAVVMPLHCPSCRDPDDVKFLLLAQQGKADYLVSGDDDVLAVGATLSCPIVSPDAFKAIVGEA